MKASELIKLLEDKIGKHGDIRVVINDDYWCKYFDIKDILLSEKEDHLVLEI